jgi:hypothetical protein
MIEGLFYICAVLVILPAGLFATALCLRLAIIVHDTAWPWLRDRWYWMRWFSL